MTWNLLVEPIFVQILSHFWLGQLKKTKVDLVQGWFSVALKSIRDIVHVLWNKINGIIKVVFDRITYRVKTGYLDNCGLGQTTQQFNLQSC